ncbi:MAG: transcription antitermination factor NusB [Clostridia bacterium]|nr:transcription antitermination factor NusB [Clostridia bacterium]
MTRKESREQAFILLFEYSFLKCSTDELFEIARETENYIEDEFCSRAVGFAIDNLSLIDKKIEGLSKGWRAERLSKVTLATLRLALAEILFMDDVPVSVSINEAVEIIKKYATEQDAAFANGILGSFVRNLEEE